MNINTKIKYLFNEYKNNDLSPSFGSFFDDNSSLDSLISNDEYYDNEDVIEVTPLNIEEPILADNVNLYQTIDIENQSILSNDSEQSDDTIELCTNTKCSYLSFIFIFFIWIFHFTINNNSKLTLLTTSYYPECKDIRNQIWRLITSNFIHIDLNHLLGNSLFLFPLMIICEKIIDKIYILFIIFIGCITSSLYLYFIIPYYEVLGSSGIVFDLLGILFGYTILNFDSLNFYFIIMNAFIISLLVGLEIISYLVHYNDNVAYAGHWFSFLSGLILSSYLLPAKKENNYKIYYRSFCLFIYLFGTIFLIIDYTKWPKYYSYNELFQHKDINNCCYELFKYLKSNNTNTRDNFICLNK